MFATWDYFNIIGFMLQIIGFIILLPQFISWISKKAGEKGMTDLRKTLNKTNEDLEHPKKLPFSYNSILNELPKKASNGIGISIVIVGLFLQLLAIFIEKL